MAISVSPSPHIPPCSSSLGSSANPQPNTTILKPRNLPRLAIDSPIPAPQPGQTLAHLLNPSSAVSPASTAAPRSFAWMLNPRSPVSSMPADHLPLPQMNEHFAPVLTHVSFDGLDEDTLPPLHAVFPATFTTPVPSSSVISAPAAPSVPAAHRSPSSIPRRGAKPAFPFTFTFSLPPHPSPSTHISHSHTTPTPHPPLSHPPTSPQEKGKGKPRARRARHSALPPAQALEPPGDPFYTHRFTVRFPPRPGSGWGWGWGPRPMGLARRWVWGRGRRSAFVVEQTSARGSRVAVAVADRVGADAEAAEKGKGIGSQRHDKGKGRAVNMDGDDDGPVRKRFAGRTGASDVHALLYGDADIRAHDAQTQLHARTDAMGTDAPYDAYACDAWCDAQLRRRPYEVPIAESAVYTVSAPHPTQVYHGPAALEPDVRSRAGNAHVRNASNSAHLALPTTTTARPFTDRADVEVDSPTEEKTPYRLWLRDPTSKAETQVGAQGSPSHTRTPPARNAHAHSVARALSDPYPRTRKPHLYPSAPVPVYRQHTPRMVSASGAAAHISRTPTGSTATSTSYTSVAFVRAGVKPESE
ncbi:hypothetical protein B0H19DRAFT_1248961 [Mycena capillaripes]|nr:hypothetical protein B0H19DRAFT_1248961 [Mycena capillaripes]